ncbi:hypothetical protein [Dethiothermospora halolimnae]|uniref:hypothetical protein n=1 Tax=Dethiothermospora halolimnae TaxID=3114390 RepID=UPI003CCBD3F7
MKKTKSIILFLAIVTISLVFSNIVLANSPKQTWLECNERGGETICCRKIRRCIEPGDCWVDIIDCYRK